MSLTKEDLKSISNLMDGKFELFEKKINKNTDEKYGELARMTADGFYEVNGKFNEVNGKFNEVNSRFNEVNGRFNEVNKRFDSVESEAISLKTEMRYGFDRVNEKLEISNMKLEALDNRTNKDDIQLYTDVDVLNKKVKKIEVQLVKGIAV